MRDTDVISEKHRARNYSQDLGYSGGVHDDPVVSSPLPSFSVLPIPLLVFYSNERPSRWIVETPGTKGFRLIPLISSSHLVIARSCATPRILSRAGLHFRRRASRESRKVFIYERVNNWTSREQATLRQRCRKTRLLAKTSRSFIALFWRYYRRLRRLSESSVLLRLFRWFRRLGRRRRIRSLSAVEGCLFDC